MIDTLESLRRKRESASELEAVVRTMKAMAASNIGQYERAVNALKDYYETVALGINAYFNQQKITAMAEVVPGVKNANQVYSVVFGSDQGLVGRFNDQLADFAKQTLDTLQGEKKVWAVGERVYSRLSDFGLLTTKSFSVPNSVTAITPLVGRILMKIEEKNENGQMGEFYIFHNSPAPGAGYESVVQRLLPLDNQWQKELTNPSWPTNNLPQVAGNIKSTLAALIREYLFVSLFKACAESLASENASRLGAMQRAEKNIDDMLGDLAQTYNRKRQSSIDQELFDVIAGFEALKENKRK